MPYFGIFLNAGLRLQSGLHYLLAGNLLSWRLMIRRSIVSLSCAVLLGLASFPARAELGDPGFEDGGTRHWFGPRGGGSDGGAGFGDFETSPTSGTVRSGARSLRLEVRNDGDKPATAWAALTQKRFCIPYTRVEVSAWFRGDDDCESTNAVAQLRIEYFQDDAGSRLIPGRVAVSEPFVPGPGMNQWTKIMVTDRVPERARTMIVTIVLMGQDLEAASHVDVWVDDVWLTTCKASRKPAR